MLQAGVIKSWALSLYEIRCGFSNKRAGLAKLGLVRFHTPDLGDARPNLGGCGRLLAGRDRIWGGFGRLRAVSTKLGYSFERNGFDQTIWGGFVLQSRRLWSNSTARNTPHILPDGHR